MIDFAMGYLCRARLLTSQVSLLLIQILTLAVSVSVFLSPSLFVCHFFYLL